MRSIGLWIFLGLNFGSAAQCVDCTVEFDTEMPSYNVTAGAVLCVPEEVTYSGAIHLLGGTLCNYGTLTNVILESGVLKNYGSIETSAAIDYVTSINNQLTVNIYKNASLMVMKSWVVESPADARIYLNVYNGGLINVADQLTFNNAFTNLVIGIPSELPGGGVEEQPATLNINGSLNINKQCQVSIAEKGVLNINSFLNLTSQQSIALENNGEVYISENLYCGGDGNSEATINIVNNNKMTVAGRADLEIYSTITSLVNNFSEYNSLFVGQNLSLSNGASFTNNGQAVISDQLTCNTGAITNNFFINANGLYVENATFTNNKYLNINNSISLWAEAGFYNNHYAYAGDQFQNNGSVYCGQSSYLTCTNLESSGNIYGPEAIEDPEEQFGTVIVIDHSSVNGALDNYLSLLDVSYEGEGPIRVDDPGIAIHVGPNVEFDRPCKISADGYIRTSAAGSMFEDSPVRAQRSEFCFGENVSAMFISPYPILSINWIYYGPYGGTSVSGTQSNWPTSSFYTISQPQAPGGCFEVTGTYLGAFGQICSFNVNFCISIIQASITATTPHYYGIGNNVTLTNTVTPIGPPYYYSWSPNVFFTAGTNANSAVPIVAPKVSLIYTVTASYGPGCFATTTVMVIGEPFAMLDKEVNGEYYRLHNNKLFFKADGQYENYQLKYNLYNKQRLVVSSNPPATGSPNLVNILAYNNGDNRYTLDLSSTSIPNGYYVLEVINEKNEKMFLRLNK